MFTERFNELLSAVCGITTGEFARITGYDRSYVSHLRNGDRVPKRGRIAAERLARAVCVCAAEKNALAPLGERVGAPGAAGDELCAAVADWLFDGESESAGKKAGPKQRRRSGSFGGRLALAMELANVSATRLARAVNVDASLLVKYRSGLRVPQVNHPIIRSLAAALATRIYVLGRGAGLAGLVGARPEELAEETEGARQLEAWLRDYDAVDTSVIENFLEGMDAFSAESGQRLLAPEEAADKAAMSDRAEAYCGVAGLRRAVLRFLGCAVRDRWEQLWLYSDQSLDWMLGDRDFSLRWASLMSAYVSGGGRIRIIHNVDRGLEEMVAAIRSWLPLYISGGIEGWYSLRAGGERFSHTLFLAPGRACVVGVSAAGGEREARYRYLCESDELAYCHAVFDALLADCRPLLKLNRDGGADHLPAMLRDRDVHLVPRSLSLATMPEPLLRSILRRAAVPGETAKRILADRAARRERMTEVRGTLHECIALPTVEALRTGAVALDTACAVLTYTPQEYAEHLRAALALARQEPGYRVYPLEVAPFARIQLAASRRIAVIEYLSGAPLTFTATHPLMCRAFVDFAARLEEQHGMDEGMLRDRLLQYTGSRTAADGTPKTEEVPE